MINIRIPINISDYINENLIIELASDNKHAALRELITVMAAEDRSIDRRGFEKAIFDRESLLSTGIGLGIAVPHARLDNLKKFHIALGRSHEGIEYDAIDGRRVNLVFMIAAPESEAEEPGGKNKYLHILSRISEIARNEDVRKKILNAQKLSTIADILRAY